MGGSDDERTGSHMGELDDECTGDTWEDKTMNGLVTHGCIRP